MAEPALIKSDESPIRVMVLVSTLAVGGAEQLLLELLRNIDRKRFALHLCFLGDPGLLGKELNSFDIPTSANVCRSRLDFLAVVRLARLFRRRRADVLLLINHRNSIFLGVPAAVLAGVGAVINWQNETFKRYSRHRLTMAARRIFHLGIRKVVAAAKGHKEYISAIEKIPPDKIQVIFNGVDPDLFNSKLSVAEARARLGLAPEGAVITMIAALRPDKAHDILLRAAALVVASLQGVRFLIVGDGSQRLPLMRLAEQLGIRENVLFLGFRRDIAVILRASDIFALSTKPEQETLSVAVIEAMAAGLPVICTDVGFMREIIIPGKTGELVQVGDWRQLARTLVDMIQDEESRRRMGASAKSLVLSKFTMEIMVKGFEDLISSVAEERR